MGTRLTWLGLEWGPLGGVRARRAALWVQMQRAAFHQGALPPKAAHRLEVVGMCWDPMVLPACLSRPVSGLQGEDAGASGLEGGLG